jgi:hypothetical protein
MTENFLLIIKNQRDTNVYVAIAPASSPHICRNADEKSYSTLKHKNFGRSEVEHSKTWKIQGMRQIESTYNEGKVVLHIHVSNSAERGAKKEQGITSSHSTRLHQWNYTPLFLSTLVIPSMYVHKAISHIHREARLRWACLPFLPSRAQATKCHQRPLTIDLQAGSKTTNLQQHHARYCLGLPIS